ncbi:hypothetical protein P5G51_002505 [Virgibacillus sp. 179-BFC.A HS]|uniref:Uncharacterized protein n=1 Tax=Tigheibacillus jepli TaxID=3035914 RepID=A0ABU5CDY9_9BACI|nr:hypothetical protein [Virgibacillus sp. 179-BFC.A HS]MDY0404435.1 hypothetical protein [Virgibacillus sp. 179-BFC.A HS]
MKNQRWIYTVILASLLLVLVACSDTKDKQKSQGKEGDDREIETVAAKEVKNLTAIATLVNSKGFEGRHCKPAADRRRSRNDC